MKCLDDTVLVLFYQLTHVIRLKDLCQLIDAIRDEEWVLHSVLFANLSRSMMSNTVWGCELFFLLWGKHSLLKRSIKFERTLGLWVLSHNFLVVGTPERVSHLLFRTERALWVLVIRWSRPAICRLSLLSASSCINFDWIVLWIRIGVTL